MKHPNHTIDIGPLTKGGAGKHRKTERFDLAVPTRITNSGSRLPYVPPTWPMRAGADDFLNCRSKT